MTRVKIAPRNLQDYAVFALSTESYVDGVQTYFEDMKSRGEQYAVQEEISSIMTNNTWELVPLTRAIESK